MNTTTTTTAIPTNYTHAPTTIATILPSYNQTIITTIYIHADSNDATMTETTTSLNNINAMMTTSIISPYKSRTTITTTTIHT